MSAIAKLMLLTETCCACLYQSVEYLSYPSLVWPHGSGSDTDDDEGFEGDEEDGDEDNEEEAKEEVDEGGTAIKAARDAARYSELCEQYGTMVQESESQPHDSPQCVIVAGTPLPPHASPSTVTIFCSHFEERAT
jgi:hypothetical protein